MIKLTADSQDLFTSLAEDAGNWSGCPLFEGTRKDLGNLTDLKVKGLVQTQESDGCVFVYFTDAGIDLATELGITDLEDYR